MGRKIVGYVKELHGKYVASDKQGDARELHVGEAVYEGDIIIAGMGNSPLATMVVTLVGAESSELLLAGNEPLMIDSTLLHTAFSIEDTKLIDLHALIKAFSIKQDLTITAQSKHNDETAAGETLLADTSVNVASFEERSHDHTTPQSNLFGASFTQEGQTNNSTITTPYVPSANTPLQETDTTAPIVTFSSILLTSDNTPTLFGTINDPEATVIVTIDNTDYLATHLDNGQWELQDDAVHALRDGITPVIVKAIDQGGNVGTASGTITVDTTAPYGTQGQTLLVQDNDFATSWNLGDERSKIEGNIFTGAGEITKNGVVTPFTQGTSIGEQGEIVEVKFYARLNGTSSHVNLTGEENGWFNGQFNIQTGVMTAYTDFGTFTMTKEGEWSLKPHNFSYTPSQWQYGFDDFLFAVKVEDSSGNRSSWIEQKILINHEPLAQDDLILVQEDSLSTQGNLLTNDQDPNNSTTNNTMLVNDGQSLAVTEAGTYVGLYGSLILEENGNFRYEPRNTLVSIQELGEGETLVDEFTYSVSDGVGGVSQAQLHVTIQGTNDPISPLIDIDTSANQLDENLPIGTYTGITLNATDSDHNDTISYSLDPSLPFTILSDGRIVTTQVIDFEQTPSFTFDVHAISSDGSSTTTSLTLTIHDKDDFTFVTSTLLPADDTGVSNQDGLTHLQTLHITGNGESGSTVVVSYENTLLGSAIIGDDGTYTITTPPLSDGAYTFTITATDPLGNQASTTTHAIVDTMSSLLISATEVVTEHLLNGSFEFNGSGNATPAPTGSFYTAYTVQGWEVIAGDIMEITSQSHRMSGRNDSLTLGSSDGSNYLDMESSPHNITIQQKISGLQAGQEVILSFDVADKALADPSFGGWNQPLGTKGENSTILEVYWNGEKVGTVNTQTSSWEHFHTTLIANGSQENTLAFREVGYAGDYHGTALDNISLTSKSLQIIGETHQIEPYQDVTLLINNTSHVITTNENGAFTFVSPPLSGSVASLSASTTDKAGNIATASTSVTFTPLVGAEVRDQEESTDTTPVSLLVTPLLPTSDTTPTLTGTVDDPNALVVLTIAGKDYRATVDAQGTWQLQGATLLAPLSQGDTSITVTAIDHAGNKTTLSTVVTIDTTPPSPPLITNVSDLYGDYSSVFLQGEGIAGSRITIYNQTGTASSNTQASGNYAIAGTTTVKDDGTWEFNISNLAYTPVNDNEFFRCTQTDQAGNVSTYSNIAHYWHGDWSNVSSEVGDDFVVMGGGNDTITLGVDDANNHIMVDGGKGSDRVKFSGSIDSYSFSLSDQGEVKVSEENGDINVFRNVEMFEFGGTTYTQGELFSHSIHVDSHTSYRPQTSFDGGSGFDILTTDISLNFATLENQTIKNIEAIDMRATGSQTLTLTLSDVLHLTDGRNDLVILGDQTDKVLLPEDQWTKTGVQTQTIENVSHTFDLYEHTQDSTVQLKVEQTIELTHS